MKLTCCDKIISQCPLVVQLLNVDELGGAERVSCTLASNQSVYILGEVPDEDMYLYRLAL